MAVVLKNIIAQSNSIKRTMATLFIVLCPVLFSVSASAQTFMEHLQQHKVGEGTVTVVQSKDIDLLVNGHDAISSKPAHADTPKNKPPKASATKKDKQQKTSVEEGHDTIAIDNSKKLLANATKVDGYRVQVYAGGNSRADKQRAQQIGAEVKALFPELPVYVHFYSPRWICRVGNFRSNEEAAKVLQELRRQGYTEASIIKGKITVQY